RMRSMPAKSRSSRWRGSRRPRRAAARAPPRRRDGGDSAQGGAVGGRGNVRSTQAAGRGASLSRKSAENARHFCRLLLSTALGRRKMVDECETIATYNRTRAGKSRQRGGTNENHNRRQPSHGALDCSTDEI